MALSRSSGRFGNRFGATHLKTAVVVGAILILTISHFVAGRGTHGLHVIHIILGGMYIVPIIATTLWAGLRGGLAVTAVISVVYVAHIRVSWRDQPMENANQYAMIVVYWVIAAVAGTLVEVEKQERARRLKAERDAVIEGIASLSNALRFKDNYTRRHSEHVSRLAVLIAMRLDLPEERLDVIRWAGLLHDIGKIGIKDDVLLKPDELTPEEWTSIRQHPIIAAEILGPIHGATEIASIVLAHHESPDGSGYPKALKGDEIPVEAQIVRVADVFASLVEDRPYKPARAVQEALTILDSMAGTKVDARAYKALERLVTEGAPVL